MKKLNLLRLLAGSIALSLLSFQSPLSAFWEPAEVISDPSIPQADDSAPVLIVNSQGNALAIWTNAYSDIFYDPTIATAFYLQGSGWQPPVVISSFAANCYGDPLYSGQGNPDIAMNSSNFALAVWQARNNECVEGVAAASDGIILGAVRNTSGIWNAPTIISNTDFRADNPNVSLNEFGNGLAAWRNIDDSNDHFYTASFFIGGSWQPRTNFPDFDFLNGEGKPYPYINAIGNAVITWQARADDDTLIVQAVNNIGGVWSGPVTLDTNVLGDLNISEDPRNALANNGNAVAIWQNSGFIRASFFNGAVWGAAVTLGAAADIGANDGPEVVVDLNGNFTATWTSPDGTILSASTTNGTWSAPITISSPGNSYAFDPFRSQETLAVNTNGDVIAIYHATDVDLPLLPAIYSAFKPFGLPWLTQETVATPFDGFIDNTLNIGLADCGFAVALWQNVSNDLVYAAITGTLFATPVDASIAQCCQKTASGKRCVNILTWTPDDCVVFYNIFCNDVLIAVVFNVPGDSLQFIDTLASCRDCVYTISAVSVLGFESDPVPFIFN